MIQIYLIQSRLWVTTNNFLLVKSCPNMTSVSCFWFRLNLLVVLLHDLILDVIQLRFVLVSGAVTDDLLLSKVGHSVQSW